MFRTAQSCLGAGAKFSGIDWASDRQLEYHVALPHIVVSHQETPFPAAAPGQHLQLGQQELQRLLLLPPVTPAPSALCASTSETAISSAGSSHQQLVPTAAQLCHTRSEGTRAAWLESSRPASHSPMA